MTKILFFFLLFPLFNFSAQSNDFPLKNEDFSKIISNADLGFDGKIDEGSIDVKFIISIFPIMIFLKLYLNNTQ